ncbi:MAG: hypothetical protein BWK79_17110 [Beggiatoa sp. IS2]|nr:MAG: hypothetical protein BWK79_17110 [Beggiatoa sp. IS2]
MKAIQQFITTPTSPLLGLLQHLKQIQEIKKIFYKTLPAPLNQHCHLINFKENKIIVHADSALWATQLRYKIPELISMWQQQAVDGLSSIEAIEIRVRPPDDISSPAPSLPKILTPSYQTIELLRDQADNLSYLPLKIALLKLADCFTEQQDNLNE